jgi:hypothetical protein
MCALVIEMKNLYTELSEKGDMEMMMLIKKTLRSKRGKQAILFISSNSGSR